MKYYTTTKLFLIGLLFLGFTSCSNDELDESVTDREYQKSELRAVDGPYRMLGFSYDATGEYLDDMSIKNKIIDVNALRDSLKSSVIINPTTSGEDAFYYGYSAIDYLKEMKMKTTDSSNLSIPLTKDLLFTGNFSRTNEFEDKLSYSTKYSFATLDIQYHQKRLKLGEEPGLLMNFLDAKFVRDLNSVSFDADKFVADYGTHVLCDVKIGGLLRVTYKSSVINTNNSYKTKEKVKGGFNFTLDKIGLGSHKDREVEFNENIKDENREKSLVVRYKAGIGVDYTYNLETETPTIETKNWRSSITDLNSGLTWINWNKAYPIYDFIKDPVKKQLVKNAVEKYIRNKQLSTSEVNPVYVYYHSNNTDHYYTTQWTGDYIGGTNGWKYSDVAFYAHPKQESGTVPLYRYYHSRNTDHYYTKTWSGDYIGGTNGWKYEKIECYVFPKQVPGTVPLYSYYHSKKTDHYYTTQWSGDYIGGTNDWKYSGIECYVYPVKK